LRLSSRAPLALVVVAPLFGFELDDAGEQLPRGVELQLVELAVEDVPFAGHQREVAGAQADIGGLPPLGDRRADHLPDQPRMDPAGISVA